MEILDAVNSCAEQAIEKLTNLTSIKYNKTDIIAIGITNQRETIVIWDKFTGKPLYNAIGMTMTNTIIFLII